MNEILSNINLYFPYNTMNILDIIQILILFGVFYWLLKSLKQTRAWIITKGIIIILGLYLVMKLLSLTTIAYLFELVSGLLSIAIIIMFQPDLRKMLERIGKKDLIKTIVRTKKKNNEYVWFSEKTITETVKATNEMSNVKTGALIVLERTIPLEEWEETGIKVNSDISWQLYVNIFEKNTPLHDGAIIVSNNKISAATCYLPLSENENIDKSLGTRHRAGIGITECTDAIVVIVSEETGDISFIENGNIQHGINQGKLSELLYFSRMKNNEDKEEKNKKKNTRKNKTTLLKIFSMFIAVITWFLTINANDEIIKYTYENIPIQTKNEQVLEETGYSYTMNSSSTIDVSIKARRSIIEQIKNENIKAIANFKELSITNAVPINVSIDEKYENYVEIENISMDTITLSIENTETVEIPIETKIIGIERNGFKAIINDKEQETIKITGPHSIVSIIDKATAVVDVSNKESDFTSTTPLIIYDRNGSEMDLNKLTLSKDKVDIYVNLYKIKYVPIEIIEPDCPDNKLCELISYETNIKEVPIVGEEEILSTFEKLEIQIGLEDSLTTNWAYKLPEGVYPATNNTSITIQSKVDVYEYTTFTIPSSSLEIKGLDTNETLKLTTSSFTFFAYVEIETKNNIDPLKLEPTIDLTNVEDGKALVTFRDTDGVRFTTEHRIGVNILNKGKMR